jgi:hypothetical protein
MYLLHQIFSRLMYGFHPFGSFFWADDWAEHPDCEAWGFNCFGMCVFHADHLCNAYVGAGCPDVMSEIIFWDI